MGGFAEQVGWCCHFSPPLTDSSFITSCSEAEKNRQNAKVAKRLGIKRLGIEASESRPRTLAAVARWRFFYDRPTTGTNDERRQDRQEIGDQRVFKNDSVGS